MNSARTSSMSAGSVTFGELLPEEIGSLSAFLREGLGDECSTFCNEDVLTWKYFGRTDEDRTVSLVARDEDGKICAHVGATYCRFVLPDSGTNPLRGMFPIDWLSSRPGVGRKLVRVALTDAAVLYVVGGTQEAARALRKLQCKKILDVPVKRRFLSVRGAVKQAFLYDGGSFKKTARALQYAGKALLPLPAKPKNLYLERISEFTELDLDLPVATGITHTIRTPDRMNHLLSHPHQNISGWRICDDGGRRGYALLRVGSGSLVRGKIVDCQLDVCDSDTWINVFTLLTHQLSSMGVDVVTTLACLPLWQAALGASNYHSFGSSELVVHSSGAVLSSDDLMITSLEGDHGYF